MAIAEKNIWRVILLALGLIVFNRPYLGAQGSSSPDTVQILHYITKAKALSNSNSDSSLIYLEKARRMADQAGIKKLIARYRLAYAGVYYVRSNFVASMENAMMARKIYEEIQDRNGIAAALINMGMIYSNAGNYEKGMQFYVESLRAGEALDNADVQARAHNQIGLLMKEQRRDEEAMAAYYKTIAFYKRSDDHVNVSGTYLNIANIYQRKKDFAKAIQLRERSLAMFDSLKIRRGIVVALNGLGEDHEHDNKLDMAVGYYQQALEKAGEDYTSSRISSWSGLGNIYLRMKNYDLARSCLMRAKALVTPDFENRKLIMINETLEKCYRAQGLYKEAAEVQHDILTLKDSLFNEQMAHNVELIKVGYELDKKENEIALLSKENELQQKLRKTQQSFYISVVSILFLLALGLLYFLNQKRKANRVLQIQKRVAEDLNQLNGKLFSIISHDLRGPLNSLSAVLQLATNKQLTEKELVTLLESIGDNTQHVTDLLDNLLNWAKSHLKGNTVNPEDVSLNDLVLANIRLLNPLAQEKHIVIARDIPSAVWIHADRNMADLVLRNLLSNAIKFTPELGEITIRCVVEASFATVSIQDTGVGIPAEQQIKLFSNQNFSTRGTANERGTGLGLILCREFIEKCGGTIWVKSIREKGSTFFFTFPLAQNNPVTATAQEASLEVRLDVQ